MAGVVDLHERLSATLSARDDLLADISDNRRDKSSGADSLAGGPQLYVVPKGVEHRRVADGDVNVVLVEPEDTVNTGDAGGPLTAVPEDLTVAAADTAGM